MTFAPTPEQRLAAELFLSGKSLAIEAGAGTGKTSTLIYLAESTPRHGYYIAFNKAIVDEARSRFPETVTCSTAHALAVRQAPAAVREALNRNRIWSRDIARILNTQPFWYQAGAEKRVLQPVKVAALAVAAVASFCKVAAKPPTSASGWRRYAFAVTPDGFDMPDQASEPNRNAVADHIAPYAQRIWESASTGGNLCHKGNAFDIALKLWQLSAPYLPCDYLLIDEAQDLDPLMQDVANVQAIRGTQVVWVGDTQQQIYSWRGAVNAMANADVEERTYLQKSFRFGPAVAAVANECLGQLDAVLRIEGHEPVGSYVAAWHGGQTVTRGPAGTTPAPDAVPAPNVILSRTNAALIGRALDELAAGGRPYIVGGAADVIAFAKAAERLQNDLPTEHPDLIAFTSWAQVVDFVELDESAGDLKRLVKIIDTFGAGKLAELLERCTVEAGATLTLSTAHKAKGREWDVVQLADDFRDLLGSDVDAEEIRLLYVAVTRARKCLDITLHPNGAQLAGLAAWGAAPQPAPAPETPANAPETPAAAPSAPNTPDNADTAARPHLAHVDRLPCCNRKPRTPAGGWADGVERTCCGHRYSARVAPASDHLAAKLGADVDRITWEELAGVRS